MKLEEFKEICSAYFGEFKKSEWCEIKFCSKNEIARYFQNGTIYTQKKVDCEIELTKRGDLSACEKTYAILGGCGGYSGTTENLKSLLTRYNFKPKPKEEQITLFDL